MVVYSLPYRQRRRRKIRWLFFLTVFLTGGLLVFLTYLVFQSNFLKVGELTIENNRLTTEDELMPVLSAAVIQKENWRKWFGPERLIFWLGLDSLSISQKIPLVKNVEIKTDIKNRRVIIKISERELAGLWCSLSEECAVFDQTGITFGHAPRAEGNLFLKIKDQEIKTIQLGQPVFDQPTWLAEIQKIIVVLKSNKIDFSEIVVKPHYFKEWEVNLVDGPVLKFSFEQMPSDFEKVITNLRETLDWSKLIYFDFRVPNRVYYQ